MADRTLAQSLNCRHLRRISIGHVASVADRSWLRVANRSAARLAIATAATSQMRRAADRGDVGPAPAGYGPVLGQTGPNQANRARNRTIMAGFPLLRSEELAR